MMKTVYILDIVVLKWWYKFARTYQIVHYKGVNLVYANCTSTNLFFKKRRIGLPWGVQWIRIQLPMQETQVQSLVQEDPTCCRATKAVCVPQLLSPCSRAHNPKQLSLRIAATEAQVPRVCVPQQEKLPQWEVLAPQLESSLCCCSYRKPVLSNEDPSTTNNK